MCKELIIINQEDNKTMNNEVTKLQIRQFEIKKIKNYLPPSIPIFVLAFKAIADHKLSKK